MNRKRVLAAALAATFVLTAAPVMDMDITGINQIRPVMAQEKVADYDTSVRPLMPLTTTIQYFSDKDDKGELLESHWTSINYMGNPAENQRQITDALTEYSVGEDSTFRKTRKRMLKEVKVFRAECLQENAPFYGPFEYKIDLHVRRADSRVVSFQEFFSDYNGGVHGMYGVTGKSFDTASGRELKLTDLFSDTDGLLRAIKQQLGFDYPNASFMESGGELLNELDNAMKEGYLNWTIDPRGVTFYFNPYHIGSYAEGIFQTTILFSEYPDIYKKNSGTGSIQWTGPKEYCMELVPYQTTRLSDSPRNDRIYVTGYEDEILIDYCGTRLQDACHAKRVRPVLVNLKDGRRYLYADYTKDGSNYQLRVYDLNGSEPKFVKELPMTRLDSHSGSQALQRWSIMSDPENFFMYSAKGSPFMPGKWLRCRVGSNGLPEVYEVEGAKG